MPLALKTQTAYADQSKAATPGCPHCQGDMLRIHRRPIDRVLSCVTPAQRYRCLSFACQWEGNIRLRTGASRAAVATPARPDTSGLDVLAAEPETRIPRTFVACMVATLAGAVFIVMGTYSDWLPSGLDANALASESTWRSSTVVLPAPQPERPIASN